MSVIPYPIRCYRDSKWIEIQTNKLLPGDIVSIGTWYVVRNVYVVLTMSISTLPSRD